MNEVENSSLMVKFKMLSFKMTGFKRLQIAGPFQYCMIRFSVKAIEKYLKCTLRF